MRFALQNALAALERRGGKYILIGIQTAFCITLLVFALNFAFSIFEFFFVFAVSSALGVLTGENLTLLAGEFTEEVPLLLSPWAVPAVAALAALLSAGATLYARRTMAKGEIAALLHNE